MEHTFAVIMAGGGGTRLWPVSRKERPKQLLPLIGDETLFQSTVERLENLFPPERILVVTVEEQAREMLQQAPSIPQENYILEPAPRGTASVVGLAAAILQKRDPDASMAILPSDHFIIFCGLHSRWLRMDTLLLWVLHQLIHRQRMVIFNRASHSLVATNILLMK